MTVAKFDSDKSVMVEVYSSPNNKAITPHAAGSIGARQLRKALPTMVQIIKKQITELFLKNRKVVCFFYH
ncbi:hypothetical protein [Brenneria corticis]|uniref:Uncharacterized protein n=1 Tax=Brenneria corticis TaxID=2173106 RepID=A0A2U1U3R4_9GAMM|nr:hypothetical protein [Brenneria sp. CFCC 11842]PWC16296.1 hypothetical protein DDT56_09430 [Brenneria sp. CFCC 11842]